MLKSGVKFFSPADDNAFGRLPALEAGPSALRAMVSIRSQVGMLACAAPWRRAEGKLLDLPQSNILYFARRRPVERDLNIFTTEVAKIINHVPEATRLGSFDI